MDTDSGAFRHLAERPKKHPPIAVVEHDGHSVPGSYREFFLPPFPTGPLAWIVDAVEVGVGSEDDGAIDERGGGGHFLAGELVFLQEFESPAGCENVAFCLGVDQVEAVCGMDR